MASYMDQAVEMGRMDIVEDIDFVEDTDFVEDIDSAKEILQQSERGLHLYFFNRYFLAFSPTYFKYPSSNYLYQGVVLFLRLIF